MMQRRVQLLLVVYVYDAEEETFLPVPDMPLGLSSHLSAVIQHLHQISSGELQAMYKTRIIAAAAIRHCTS